MENKVIPGVLGVFVVICLVGGMLVPIIDGMGEGEPTVNPDAGWIRMNYDTAAGSTYTVTITPGDDDITVANGSDTQTGSDDTIFYADSNVAVWMQDGTVNILGQNTDGPQFLQPEEAITVTRTAEGVTVASGGDSFSFATPAWAYVPFSSGNYGYFTDGTAVKTNSPMAAVGGGFAGVYAYNDITRYAGLGLQLQTVMEDGKLTGAYWAKPAAADSLSITPFDPGSITIQPLDPGVISLDPEPDASIMSVPTPSYTDGDWGYNLVTEDGIQRCVIVSYSGAGGDIVVPATVGGYDVFRVGKDKPTLGSYNQVINNSSISAGSNLIISEGIKQIGGTAFVSCTNLATVKLADSIEDIGVEAFKGCTGFTASLNLPANLKTIGYSAFENCKFTNSLILPNGLATIGNGAFRGITTMTPLLLVPASVVDLGNQTFSGMFGIKTIIVASDATPAAQTYQSMNYVLEVLDLSEYEYVAGSNGISANAVVQDNIGDSAGYIGTAMVPGPSGIPSSITGLMFAIPIVIFAACIAVGAAVYLKRE